VREWEEGSENWGARSGDMRDGFLGGGVGGT